MDKREEMLTALKQAQGFIGARAKMAGVGDGNMLLLSWFKALELAINELSVDAAPVVHGEWKTDGDVMWCSVCKMPVAKTRITGATGRTHFIHIKTKYCSNCGARNMEERKWMT